MDDQQIFQKGIVVEKRGIFGHRKIKQKRNLKQMASYHTKFLKDGFPINGVEAFATSIYSTTQLRWTSRTIQTP
jgi:hypothetical protein